jgi:hypothetical protein
VTPQPVGQSGRCTHTIGPLSARLLQIQAAVYLATVADGGDRDDVGLVVNGVNDAVVTGSHPKPGWIAASGDQDSDQDDNRTSDPRKLWS